MPAPIGLCLRYDGWFPIKDAHESFECLVSSVHPDPKRSRHPYLPEMFAKLGSRPGAFTHVEPPHDDEDAPFAERLRFIRVGGDLHLCGNVRRVYGEADARRVATDFGVLLSLAAAGLNLRPRFVTLTLDDVLNGPSGPPDERGRLIVPDCLIGWGLATICFAEWDQMTLAPPL